MLRPPPPDLRGVLPAGRVELRKADKNGLSIRGEPRFAPDLHDWGRRYVLVIRGASGPLPVLTRDGRLTFALTGAELNEAFRDAFYANRRAQRDRIEQRAERKLLRDGGGDAAMPKRRTAEPTRPPAAKPAPLDSPPRRSAPARRPGMALRRTPRHDSETDKEAPCHATSVTSTPTSCSHRR